MADRDMAVIFERVAAQWVAEDAWLADLRI